MTNEELVYLYQNGDEHALEELVRNNQRVINKVAHKFNTERTSSIDIEDLKQEGYIGLITAADKYDFNNPSKASFITYATFWIYQKISLFFKKKNTNGEISLNVPVPSDKDIQVDIIETLEYEDNPFPDPQDELLKKQLRKELEEIMNDELSMKERNIIMLHYGWEGNVEMPLTDIAEMLSITRASAANIEHRSFGKIRRTKWAIMKRKELYEKRFINNYEGYSGIDEKLTFLQIHFPEVKA